MHAVAYPAADSTRLFLSIVETTGYLLRYPWLHQPVLGSSQNAGGAPLAGSLLPDHKKGK